jgi:nicotinamide mononucleotide (NMN) deamidase PncC
MLDQLETLAAHCAAILLERGQSVAVADGSTGGLISAGMLTISGGIKFFRGGGVLYSLKGRQILFGLEPNSVDRSVCEARQNVDRISTGPTPGVAGWMG